MTADKYHLWQWGERTLSGSRFSVRLHRSLGLSLHHPAKSFRNACHAFGRVLR